MNEVMAINIISIFVLSILYLSILFSQSISKTNMFYGVRISSEEMNAKELRQIDKNFKKYITGVFVITVVAECILLNGTKLKNPFDLLGVIGFSIVSYYVIYLKAYKKAKNFKESKIAQTSSESETDKKGKKIIDIDFINEKNSLRKIFFYLYVVLALLVLGVTIYALVSYESLPQRIPTHWNFRGEADAWNVKSFYQVFFPNMMNILLFFLLAYFSLNTFSLRIKLDAQDIEKSKKRAIKYLKGISISFYILTCSIVFLLGTAAVAMINQSNISPYIIGLNLLFLLFAIVLLFYYYYKYGNVAFSKEKEEKGYSVEDEDKYWIAGFIYNNPDDPLVIVDKRYGLGWTINVGNLKGKLIMIFLLIFVLITLISPFVFS